VLVADDDADIRVLVGIAVRKSGLELVGTAIDGIEALDLVRELKPDLLVTDVSMPGLTGLELCTLIRDDDELSGTRVVLLSAAVDEGAHAAGRDAGATEYLIKPFSPRQLADRLVELTRSSAART
jgi:DNA-binding response OmpR family regulator